MKPSINLTIDNKTKWRTIVFEKIILHDSDDYTITVIIKIPKILKNVDNFRKPSYFYACSILKKEIISCL